LRPIEPPILELGGSPRFDDEEAAAGPLAEEAARGGLRQERSTPRFEEEEAVAEGWCPQPSSGSEERSEEEAAVGAAALGDDGPLLPQCRGVVGVESANFDALEAAVDDSFSDSVAFSSTGRTLVDMEDGSGYCGGKTGGGELLLRAVSNGSEGRKGKTTLRLEAVWI
jgi:hypothetical protein